MGWWMSRQRRCDVQVLMLVSFTVRWYLANSVCCLCMCTYVSTHVKHRMFALNNMSVVRHRKGHYQRMGNDVIDDCGFSQNCMKFHAVSLYDSSSMTCGGTEHGMFAIWLWISTNGLGLIIVHSCTSTWITVSSWRVTMLSEFQWRYTRTDMTPLALLCTALITSCHKSCLAFACGHDHAQHCPTHWCFYRIFCTNWAEAKQNCT